MINISHVKKYEQATPWLNYSRNPYKTLFLSILVLICTTFGAYGEEGKRTNRRAGESESRRTGELASWRAGELANWRAGELASKNEPEIRRSGELAREKDQKSELPLEISEKYYKKEAILKFNDAVKKWESMSALEAISLFGEAIQIDPNLWISYLGLGQAYDFQKEYTKSLEAYKEYLKLAPKEAPDKQAATETIKYLTHLLRYGEQAIKGEDYLSLVKTKHQGKEHYVRWDLSNPLKIYFYPAEGVPSYRKEYEQTFLDGAMIWQEVLPDLTFEVLENKIPGGLSNKKAKEKEKEIIDSAQIKVIFPSRFKVKGDPKNPIASEIDAQSFPIIRDKKNFRVLGVIMISPYIYYQSQIAVPLEPLSKLNSGDQIKKLKIISAREVGHALGLWGFSPNPDDLMFDGAPTELRLSQRDKNTIKKLYELDPKIGEVTTNK